MFVQFIKNILEWGFQAAFSSAMSSLVGRVFFSMVSAFFRLSLENPSMPSLNLLCSASALMSGKRNSYSHWCFTETTNDQNILFIYYGLQYWFSNASDKLLLQVLKRFWSHTTSIAPSYYQIFVTKVSAVYVSSDSVIFKIKCITLLEEVNRNLPLR